MRNRFPFNWIINHFTYLQTYIFICILFFLSLVPILYFWVTTHLDRISLVDSQLNQLKEENSLAELLNHMELHRLYMQRTLLSENKQTQTVISDLETQIHTTLQNFMDNQKKIQSRIFEPTIWQSENPNNILVRWDELIKRTPNLSREAIEAYHTAILYDLLIQFSYISDRISISNYKEIENYALLDGLLLRLPSIQENLSQLILLSEEILLSEGKSKPRERIYTLMSFLESDLSYLRPEGVDESYPDYLRSSLLKTINKYKNAIESLMLVIKRDLLNKETIELTLAQFQKPSDKATNTGNKLWEEGLKDLGYIFHAEREHVSFQLWLVLIATLLLTSFAFWLGLVLTRSGTSRLSQLTAATNSFTNGNLSVRVADEFQDEIGRQSQAFNQMAQKLEEIINHLYELLGATKALSTGNLTARISTTNGGDPEFDQVALSFNKMALNFETIIGRLQQIGSMLTSSASEIATASKEHETNIVEQEATTREIAVAANEISTTSKEFANTMNEMSQMAEQTSDLALTGKGALNNMESIMSLMVDASRNIAAKLAILNEKAGNIVGVITTITKVADQTNLLSLNASIEAEKAGEYGRSFAVIAREIRRLADQTAIATLDIEKIVNEIMSAVSTSVMGVDDFTQEIRNGVDQTRSVSGQLAKIIEQVQVFTARFELLNQGMQAQSTGAEQINEAISQLSQTAKITSEAIHQLQKTIQELNNAANELHILTPFIRTKNLEEEETSSEKEKPSEQALSESPSKEAAQKVKDTLSNLNSATSKLKNLNMQLRSPFHKKEGLPKE